MASEPRPRQTGWRAGFNPDYRHFIVTKLQAMSSTMKHITGSVLLTEFEHNPVQYEERIFEIAENELDYVQRVNTVLINLDIEKWKATNTVSPNGDTNPCVPNSDYELQNKTLLQEKMLHQHMRQHQHQYLYRSPNSEFKQQVCVQQVGQPAENLITSMSPSLQPLYHQQLAIGGDPPVHQIQWQQNNPLLHGLQREPNFVQEMRHTFQEPGSFQQLQNGIEPRKQLFQRKRGLQKILDHEFIANCQEDTNHKVYPSLIQEIREINHQLRYTIVSIEAEDINQKINFAETRMITIKCSSRTVGPDPIFKHSCTPEQLVPIWELRLLISSNYPKSCPDVLGTIPAETNHNGCYRSLMIFNINVKSLTKPVSIGKMAEIWERSCLLVVTDIAKQLIQKTER